jgi:hypothetical protein
MTTTVIENSGDDASDPLAASAAHDAAVAEGAAGVQAEGAAVSAAEASAAAEIALEAAQANMATAEQVIAATETAEGSAQAAQVSAEMVMDALNAQSAAISALAEEFKASRKSDVSRETTSRQPPPDREPGSSGHWYYGKGKN